MLRFWVWGKLGVCKTPRRWNLVCSRMSHWRRGWRRGQKDRVRSWMILYDLGRCLMSFQKPLKDFEKMNNISNFLCFLCGGWTLYSRASCHRNSVRRILQQSQLGLRQLWWKGWKWMTIFRICNKDSINRTCWCFRVHKGSKRWDLDFWLKQLSGW